MTLLRLGFGVVLLILVLGSGGVRAGHLRGLQQGVSLTNDHLPLMLRLHGIDRKRWHMERLRGNINLLHGH